MTRELGVPSNVHWRRFGAELVVLDLGQGRYYGLNAVASCAFEAIARGDGLAEIMKDVLSRFDVEPGRLRDDLQSLLDELVEKGLLRRSGES
jgi:hypothetical protein